MPLEKKEGAWGAAPKTLLKTIPFIFAINVNNALFYTKKVLERHGKSGNSCDHLSTFNEIFKQKNKEKCVWLAVTKKVLERHGKSGNACYV